MNSIVTGMPSEAKKIAAFARRIGASRVQLNTASRPPADMAGGLGIHVTEALKRLDALIKAGKVTTVLVGGRTFYTVARWMEASEVKG